MSILNKLSESCIQIGSSSAKKKEVIKEIAALAKNSNVLSSFPEKKIINALQEREKSGTTAFGEGIAIPHCRFDEINDFVIGALISKEGIPFEELDKKPVHILFFIIGPTEERNKHIQYLSEISKILKDKDIKNALIAAEGSSEVKNILQKKLKTETEPSVQTEQCLFHIFIQREEFLNDILEIFNAAVKGSFTIVEGNRAGSYLYRLPLFSTYWSQEDTSYNKIIIGVVEKSLCNEVIRRINVLTDSLEGESGIMITAQELMYSSGSLAF